MRILCRLSSIISRFLNENFLSVDYADYTDQKQRLKTAVFVLWNIAYNFCYGSFVSYGYFATEDNEEKRERREKIKKEIRF